MNKVHFKGSIATIDKPLFSLNDTIPNFTLVKSDLSDFNNDSINKEYCIFNIFPSIDTGVCATSVRKFNEMISKLENVEIICVSKDLPFALSRFCGAENIQNLTMTSDFRNEFAKNLGLTLLDTPLKGLLARSIIITKNQKVIYFQLVEEITNEPDYDSALSHVK